MKIKTALISLAAFFGLVFVIQAAITFNGTTDYISLGTLGSFGGNMSKGFTISLWIKIPTAMIQNNIKAVLGEINTGTTTDLVIQLNRKGDNTISSGYTQFGVRDNSGLVFSQSVSTNVAGNINIYDNAWHHIAWIVSNPATNSMAVYYDGLSQTLDSAKITQSPATFSNFGFSMYLGGQNQRGPLSVPCNCTLDDVRFYSYPLSAGEVPQLALSNARIPYNVTSGKMTGWWKLDETSASAYGVFLGSATVTFYDSSGNANNGLSAGTAINAAQSSLSYP